MTDFKPTHLGKQSQDAVETLDLIPNTYGPHTVTVDCSEFTSHCPVTRQPDFGTLSIEYEPDGHLIETKSLKLFLWRYRDEAMFNEAIVNEIADKIEAQVEPGFVTVTGKFNTRGGISVTCVATR